MGIFDKLDHWYHAQTMAALQNGKDVYLEKPITRTVEEAKEIADAVTTSGRVRQVGSRYASMDHFWKARKAIEEGLLGDVMWPSGGFGRNRNLRGEWNYAIDPDATGKTLDWKAFPGPAPACPVGSGVGAPLVVHGSKATLFIGQNSESLASPQMELVPDAEYRDEFVKKTGAATLMIEAQPVARGTHPHMDNFLECVRSRQEPNLPAALGYQATAAIGMGVQAYQGNPALFFDRRREKGEQPAVDRLTPGP